MYKRILLVYDGTEVAQAALATCDEIARMHQAEVLILAVIPYSTLYVGWEGAVHNKNHEDAEKKRYREIVKGGLRRLSSAGHSATGEVVVGESVDQICKFAEKEGADLLIVGVGRHRRTARLWKGSISVALVQYSRCSVLWVIE